MFLEGTWKAHADLLYHGEYYYCSEYPQGAGKYPEGVDLLPHSAGAGYPSIMCGVYDEEAMVSIV